MSGVFSSPSTPQQPQPSYARSRDDETMQWLGLHPWATPESISGEFGQFAPNWNPSTGSLNFPGNWYSQPRVDVYNTAFNGWNMFEKPEGGGVDYTLEPDEYIKTETQFERGESFRDAYSANASRINSGLDRSRYIPDTSGRASIVRGMFDPTVRGYAQNVGYNRGRTLLDPVNQSPEARAAYEAEYANQLSAWENTEGYNYNALARQLMGG